MSRKPIDTGDQPELTPAAPIINNLNRWMTDIPDIEHLKLHELVLTSAHNAGVDQKNAGWPTDQWGACQNDSFAYQLSNGARAFDLRLYRNIDEIATPKEFIFKHGTTFHSSRYLNDLLQTVKSFASLNPMEFVFLDFQKVYADEGEQKINSAITSVLGMLRLPPVAKDLTIAQIRKRYPGQNVIVAWDNKLNYTTWPKIHHTWINQENVNHTDLDNFIVRTMSDPPTGYIWSMQAVGFDILTGPIRYSSNQEFWYKFFNASFFASYRSGKTKGSIINVDFLVGTGAVPKCIDATRNRAAAAKKSAPRNLTTGGNVFASWLTLAWDNPEDAEPVLDYSVFHNNNFILSTSENTTAITFLKPSTTHNFQVRANFNSGSGAITELTVDTLAPHPSAPSAPKNLKVTNKTFSSATLTWNASPAGENISGYIVWLDQYTHFTTTTPNHEVNGLSAGGHDIDVAAFDKNNVVSATISIRFLIEEQPPIPPPPAPENFRGTSLPGKINFEWNPVSRAIRYDISTGLGFRYSTTSTSLTIDCPQLLLSYSVSAISAEGLESSSRLIWKMPLPIPAPTRPENFSGSSFRGGVSLRWDGVPNTTKYELYRQFTTAPIATVTDTSIALTGLPQGRKRYHVVAVLKSGGKSERSDYLTIGPTE